MKHKLLYLLALLFLVPLASCSPSLRTLANTTVLIRVDSPMGSWAGTGVAIEHMGSATLLLSNHHVCGAQGNAIYTITDYRGEQHAAVFIRNAPEADLCLLSTADPLPTAKLAKRNASPSEPLTAIGYPRAQGFYITQGFAAGFVPIDMPLDLGGEVHFVAQAVSIECAPGSSGSPVFNSSGEVVGLIFAGRTDTGFISIIVPVSYIHSFLDTSNNLHYLPDFQ